MISPMTDVNRGYMNNGPHNAFLQQNFPPVNYTQPNYVSLQNVRTPLAQPVGSNYSPRMGPPQRNVQPHGVSSQYMSQYNTNSSQNTIDVSICDRYQQNTCLYQSYFPANNQQSSQICFNSTYHQSNYLQTNMNLPQHSNYSSYFPSENNYFNIQNLPNIQLRNIGNFTIPN